MARPSIVYCAELKIDGLAISLSYALEAPLRVGEADGQAIDLELGAVHDLVADRGADALVEASDLGLIESVLQAEHRRPVADLGELVGGLAAHALGRGVRRQQVRPLVLDAAQLQEQRVVLAVRDLRRVEYVVGVLVPPDELAQLLHADRRVDRGLLALRHLVSGANMPLRIFRPTLSNLITSSSSVRVSVLLTTVPAPNAGWLTRSPLANRCTGGGAGAASTCRSR